MPTPPAFAQAFPAYLASARTARAESRHHGYRRGLFLDLLRQAFGIRADEVRLEQFVRIDMRRRGWIDALFRNLVFEFKRDLERERGDGKRELADNLATLPNGADIHVGAAEPAMPAFDESKYEPMPEVEINPDDEFHVDV